MLVAKILFNSVISAAGAKFMMIDLLTFYLMTPLKWPEYISMKLSDKPEEIIKEYKLLNLVDKAGYIHSAVCMAFLKVAC